TDSDNDGDDFVYPKLTTHDDEERQDDKVNEEGTNEESYDKINEDSDEEVQSENTEEEEIDEEATHKEDEVNELYRDVNINLEGRDTVMTDAPLPNVQGTQVTEDTHVIITALIKQSSSVSSGFVSNMLNPSPDIGIDMDGFWFFAKGFSSTMISVGHCNCCIRKEEVSRRRFYGTGGDGSNSDVEEAENEQEWTLERMKNYYYSRIHDQSKCEEAEEQHTPGHNKCCMSEEEVSTRGMLRR
ncbi:hypothetical protein Tco_1396234, partial [Tanacetum coccineum]